MAQTTLARTAAIGRATGHFPVSRSGRPRLFPMLVILLALFVWHLAVPGVAATPWVEFVLAGALLVLGRVPLIRGVRCLVYRCSLDTEGIAVLGALIAFHYSFVVATLDALGRLGETFYIAATGSGSASPALQFTTAAAAITGVCLADRLRSNVSGGLGANPPDSAPSRNLRADTVWGATTLLVAFAFLAIASIVAGEITATGVTITLALLFGATPGIFSAFGDQGRRSLEQWAEGEGVEVHRAGALDDLGKIRTVCFNRLGTITYARPRVSDVVPADIETTPEDILNLASIIEIRADHPFAGALRDRMREDSPTVPQLRDVHYFPGRGVRAELHGQEVVLGSPRYLEELGVSCDEQADEIDHLCRAGKSVLALARDERLIGLVGFQDSPRPEAHEVIKALGDLGLETRLFSGDSAASVESVANSLGMDRYHSGLSREKGCTVVRDLQASHGRDGSVAMVGRGAFHATFLSIADCGVAFGPLGEITPETGDLELPGRSLCEVSSLFQMAAAVRARWRHFAVVALMVQAILSGSMAYLGWQLCSGSASLTGSLVDIPAAVALAATILSAVIVRSACGPLVIGRPAATVSDEADLSDDGIGQDAFGEESASDENIESSQQDNIERSTAQS
jgi:cation transport ATPase